MSTENYSEAGIFMKICAVQVALYYRA